MAWLLATLAPTIAHAEEVAVPVSVQASLLVKVAGYDRNMQGRGQGAVRILIVVNSSDIDSRNTAAQMDEALSGIPTVAGQPKVVQVVPFPGASALLSLCKKDHVSIVYLSSGLESAAGELGKSFDGVDILTASAIARYVPAGIVLGFDLVSGKVRLTLNQPQAQKQNVAIKPDVVSLMKVFK